MMPGLWECKARSNPWASCRYNKKKYSSLFSDMMNFADFAALSIKSVRANSPKGGSDSALTD